MSSGVIVIEKDLIRSEVHRSLTRTANYVYSEFLMRRQFDKRKHHKRKDSYTVRNNGKIVYTYAEAEKQGISPQQFARSIDQLLEKGFIDIEHLGSGSIKKDKSLYSISDRWKLWGTDEFIEKKRPKDKRNITFKKKQSSLTFL